MLNVCRYLLCSKISSIIGKTLLNEIMCIFLQTTPLLTASYYGRVEVVELLLKYGADVTLEDSETEKGTTHFSCNCLGFAILYGHR